MDKKRKTAKRAAGRGWWLAAALLALIALAVALRLLARGQADTPTATQDSELRFSVPNLNAVAAAPVGAVNDALLVENFCTYSGAFFEDGSDEAVSDVLALVVTNTSGDWIALAELTVDCGDGTQASFQITGFPAESSVLVLERNRLPYDAAAEYALPVCARLAELTDEKLDFSADFQLYADDGVLNIQNISARDFMGDIAVYYKTYQYGLYLGGLTYCARVQGGLAAQKIAQCLQQHYTLADSVILYMSYAD